MGKTMDRENQSEINIKYCRLLLFDEAYVDFRLVIARERKKKLRNIRDGNEFLIDDFRLGFFFCSAHWSRYDAFASRYIRIFWIYAHCDF